MKKKQDLWDNIAKSFHVTSWHSKGHRDKYIEISNLIISKNPGNILDLGCGSGILEKILDEKGFNGKILAIDASPNMLQIAKEFVKNDNCRFKHANLEKPFNIRERFDIVVAINIFFFLEKKQQFLENVYSLMNDSNSIFIMVNPKPNNEVSNLEFIKEHFRETRFFEKISIFVKELINIPKYIKMFIEQSKLSAMVESGELQIDNPETLKIMAKRANLNIISKGDIHANQNWVFIMRRA